MKRNAYWGLLLGIFLTGMLSITCTSTQPVPSQVVNTTRTEVSNGTERVPINGSFKGYREQIPLTTIGFEMVEIPAGSFLMGSPETEENRKADEGPRHKVALEAYYMGKYEVTWNLFELFYKKNQELFVKLDQEMLVKVDAISGPSPPYEDPSYGMGKEGYPVVSVSTYSALVFCKWLSTITGRFYRLPTEAEWEYAARAGSEAPYYFGDAESDLDQYAVYYNNSNDKYAKVGTKLPNAWGLFDMHGNVAEWTMDEYKADAYATHEEKNPWVTPKVIHPRVFRGGSWDDDADALRSAARGGSSMNLQRRDPQIPKSFWWFSDNNFIGFRLVSPKNQPSQEAQAKFWQLVLDEG
ncbi:MAG: formylglycine-generating enzyme family protein [Bacteroidota bacterium]